MKFVIALTVTLLQFHCLVAQELLPQMLSDMGLPEETVLTDGDFERAKGLSDSELNNFGLNDDELEKSNKFEGDIVKPDSSVQNNAMRGDSLRWPSAQIAYSISSSYSSRERSIIASAMAEYQRETCVRFVGRSNERNYLYIFKGSGCYSNVGRIGGRQELSLGNGCVTKGIAIHEFMHAAGFLHEQSRTDRDQYISIQYQNIQSGLESQFKKYSQRSIDHMGTPYDLGSIMHYGAKAFTKNGQATIIPINPRNARIGQRNGLSSNDILKLNKMYKCSGGGATPRPATQRPVTYRPAPNTPRPNGRCQDQNSLCGMFSQFGYCRHSSVKSMCRASCDDCGTGGGGGGGSRCTNQAGNSLCQMVERNNLCNSSSFGGVARSNCALSCNAC